MHDVIGRIAALFGTVVTRLTFARYTLASLCALCVDMIVFLALSHLHVQPVVAAFCGYSAGLVLHWMLSIRFVFVNNGTGTHGQRLAFIASAVLGLGITMATVSVLCGIGLAPAIAKILAIPTSFLTVYMIRRYGIFTRA